MEKKEFVIISSIEQKAKVAAITDCTQTQVLIEGAGNHVLKLTEGILLALCEAVFKDVDANDYDAKKEMLKEIDKMLEGICEKVKAQHAMRLLTKELGVLTEHLASDDSEEDE